MANYKVGDEVVCVDAIGFACPTGLTAGMSYPVLAARVSPCCGTHEIDVGTKSPTGHVRCCRCGARNPGNWKMAWRFIKLDGLKDEETERTEAPIRENA